MPLPNEMQKVLSHLILLVGRDHGRSMTPIVECRDEGCSSVAVPTVGSARRFCSV